MSYTSENKPTTLLIVEDNETYRKSLSMLLEVFGYTVIMAATFDEATDKMNELSVEDVDLALLDANLAGDYSAGFKLSEHFRGKFNKPVIAISMSMNTQEWSDAPAISKNSDGEEIIASIKKALSGKSS